MPIPPFVAELRSMVGSHELWLPGVTAVIRRDDELLLTKRADNGEWSPVTGIVDPREEPAVAAAREALEEAGVEISVERLVSVGVVPDVVYENGDRAAYLDLTFACDWVSGEARVADDENVDVRWWPISALPPMSASIRERIDGVLAGETTTRYRRPPS
jgi:8-oxo-dGTP pyrophosphatase MutT (NUDIX family)